MVGQASMDRVVDDDEVFDDDETESDDDRGTTTGGRRRRPDLLTDSEIANHHFRFSVGDIVECNICEGGYDEGTVIQRCYREDEWPSNYYAAYQVRLHNCEHCSALIYAPRDADRYIRRSSRSPFTPVVASSKRLSRERQLLQTLEASLGDSMLDDRKRKLYEKLRKRHKLAMQRIIDDVTRGVAIGA